jgi:hypothetical protein
MEVTLGGDDNANIMPWEERTYFVPTLAQRKVICYFNGTDTNISIIQLNSAHSMKPFKTAETQLQARTKEEKEVRVH